MSKIALSPLSQAKMALHSARHGFSPIHGILIGHRSANSIEVTDALPVCHEVPTRPLVNTSLRMADIYLSDKKEEILGWYTANATGGDEPNVPALRVVNSMADQSGDEMIVVLVAAEQDGPLCTVFERAGGKTFTQKVDASRIECKDAQVRDVVNRGIRGMSNFSSEYGGKGLVIYDYVDHVSSYEKREDLDSMNWIENTAVADFVAEATAR
jgi:hypothetical protein